MSDKLVLLGAKCLTQGVGSTESVCWSGLIPVVFGSVERKKKGRGGGGGGGGGAGPLMNCK